MLDNKITYTLTRSRRKTMAIYVKPDGKVEVRCPYRVSKYTVEHFIASKSLWIKQKQAQFAMMESDLPREMPPIKYAPGEFEQAARELVGVWEQRLGVSVEYIGFRAMSSRWGSCTAKTRRIRINTALKYCPVQCLEYIIVHELAHLRECNHSKRFWAIVADAVPDYKTRQKVIKSYSWLLGQ